MWRRFDKWVGYGKNSSKILVGSFMGSAVFVALVMYFAYSLEKAGY